MLHEREKVWGGKWMKNPWRISPFQHLLDTYTVVVQVKIALFILRLGIEPEPQVHVTAQSFSLGIRRQSLLGKDSAFFSRQQKSAPARTTPPRTPSTILGISFPASFFRKKNLWHRRRSAKKLLSNDLAKRQQQHCSSRRDRITIGIWSCHFCSSVACLGRLLRHPVLRHRRRRHSSPVRHCGGWLGCAVIDGCLAWPLPHCGNDQGIGTCQETTVLSGTPQDRDMSIEDPNWRGDERDATCPLPPKEMPRQLNPRAVGKAGSRVYLPISTRGL